ASPHRPPRLHEDRHSRSRLRPPGRDVSVWRRPRHVCARHELQGARARQPLRRGHELLSQHRRGEPGLDGDGQRPARGRPPTRADGVAPGRAVVASRTEQRVVYAAAAVQGIALVTFPAASTIFTSPAEYDLSNTQYGTLFLPQVITAIAAALLG